MTLFMVQGIVKGFLESLVEELVLRRVERVLPLPLEVSLVEILVDEGRY